MRSWIVLTCMVVAVLAASGYSETPARSNLDIEPVQTPAAPGSSLPQLTGSNRGVILSWIEREGPTATLKFAERTGSAWSAPRVVASGTDWFVNWADVPSVVRLANGALAAHWLQRSGADTYAYDVRLAYSTDGRTWSAPVSPHHDGTKTEHGFATLFDLPSGGLGVTWLDGRATAGSAGHESHGSEAARGAMTVRFAAFDEFRKQTSELVIDSRVCDCCPTTVAITAEGPIVAYRDRSEDETRDISLARLVNGRWSAPRTVHDDGWRIAACPVNGPMLAARERDVVAAWFTAKGDEGHAYVAFSKDAGRTFSAPTRLDDDRSLGRVDVDLLDDGAALASWIELAGEGAELRVRRIEPSGVRSEPARVATLASTRASGYPRLARHGDEVVFAWTEAGGAQSRVRTARMTVRRTPTSGSPAKAGSSAQTLR